MFEPFSFLAGMFSLPIIYLTLVFIILTIEIAYDLGVVATLTAAVFAIFAWWMGWLDVAWVASHWPEALMWTGIYLLLGIGWCALKWIMYVFAEYRKAKHMIKVNPTYAKAKYSEPLQVSDHKADIIRWMTWWPFSFVATMLNDPFRRLFEAIYNNIANVLQNISDRVFAKLQFPPDTGRSHE